LQKELNKILKIGFHLKNKEELNLLSRELATQDLCAEFLLVGKKEKELEREARPYILLAFERLFVLVLHQPQRAPDFAHMFQRVARESLSSESEAFSLEDFFFEESLYRFQINNHL